MLRIFELSARLLIDLWHVSFCISNTSLWAMDWESWHLCFVKVADILDKMTHFILIISGVISFLLFKTTISQVEIGHLHDQQLNQSILRSSHLSAPFTHELTIELLDQLNIIKNFFFRWLPWIESRKRWILLSGKISLWLLLRLPCILVTSTTYYLSISSVIRFSNGVVCNEMNEWKKTKNQRWSQDEIFCPGSTCVLPLCWCSER